jgi:hypothetical protein
LISRSAALAIVDNLRDGSFYPADLDWIARDINVLPAIDAVPVVRCKECKHRGDTDACPMLCEVYYGFETERYDTTEDDGFCHMGAKMDGGAEVD